MSRHRGLKTMIAESYENDYADDYDCNTKIVNVCYIF